MDNDRIWDLMARKLSGEATNEELAELWRAYREHPEMFYAEEILQDTWQTNEQPGEEAIEKAWQKLVYTLEQHKADAARAAKSRSKWQSSNKRRRFFSINVIRMFRNYVTIAWRNIVRGKAFFFIKIVGLAISMAGAILMMLWIWNELTYNSFHAKRDKGYMMYSRGIGSQAIKAAIANGEKNVRTE